MRYAAIKDGVVVDIFEGNLIALQESFDYQFETLNNFEVSTGWEFDGVDFTDPNATPSPVITPPPTPEPKTSQQVMSEVDSYRSQAIQDYKSQWGQASVDELWDRLGNDMRIEADKQDAIQLVHLPNIVGYLSAQTGKAFNEITLAECREVCQSLRSQQMNHIYFLTQTERLRGQILAQYAALATDAEKLAFDLKQAWDAGLV